MSLICCALDTFNVPIFSSSIKNDIPDGPLLKTPCPDPSISLLVDQLTILKMEKEQVFFLKS